MVVMDENNEDGSSSDEEYVWSLMRVGQTIHET